MLPSKREVDTTIVNVKQSLALSGLALLNITPILAFSLFATTLRGQTTAFPAKDGPIPVPTCLDMISHQQGYVSVHSSRAEFVAKGHRPTAR
jgi:hypothetical protein